ncbi:MAG: flagellar biosynthetic protein FliO [Puniceicoccales bacterium]|jgi:flagellar biogenesis protein FliO|nr:flagellar biosynthetic protein FliO [Puniceicoccales bacterium]
MLEIVVKSVIFLLLLALGGYFFVYFRKRGWLFPVGKGTFRSSDLQIQERLPIGGRHYIAIIHCDGQRFLVGISPNSITSIGELKSENITQSPVTATSPTRENDPPGQSPILERS